MEFERLIKMAKDKVAALGVTVALNETKVEQMIKDALAIQKKQDIKLRKGAWAPPVDEDAFDLKKASDIQKRIMFPAQDDFTRELQTWNDDLYLTARLMKADPRSLRMYEEFQTSKINSELRKALETADSGYGADWIPTGFSADVVDRVRLELKVGNLFERITMPTNPYKTPVVTADSTGYLQSESTANEAMKLKASNPTTSNMTFTAVKLASRVLFSEEISEDSIVPILPWLKKNVVIGIATAEEKALINGDTTSTHMDNNVTDAADCQKAWKGLRKLCQSAAKVSIATLTVENLRSIRSAMGKYGVDPKKLVQIWGISGYLQLLSLKDTNNNVMVTTVDKYGPNATILSGELAKVDGKPVIVSEWIYQNLNASGVYDGTTKTKTIMLTVYTPGFAIGDRRRLTVKTDENIETDQQILVVTERLDFEPWYDVTSEYIVGMGYNLTT